MNDSLTVNLSYINLGSDVLYEYDANQLPLHPATYEQALQEDSFTASLKKEWNLGSHTVSLGAQYRYKHFDMSDVKVNGISQPYGVYNQEDIYSVFMQDLISLNDNHLLSLSVMDQAYVRNGNFDNQNTLQLRLGYIYSDKEWVAKTFISSQEFATEPYMAVNNPNLEKTTYTSILQEVSYETSKTLSKIILGYGESDNMIIPDPQGLDIYNVSNSDIDAVLYTAIAEFTLHFSQKDKLELQANYWYLESPMLDTEDTKHYSYVVRMLNSVSGFDIFNELVIHTGYSDVDNGYDYSAGVKYQVNKDLHINIKGVNIFDTGLERRYMTTGVITDSVLVPAIERRFTLGMEYLF